MCPDPDRPVSRFMETENTVTGQLSFSVAPFSIMTKGLPSRYPEIDPSLGGPDP